MSDEESGAGSTVEEQQNAVLSWDLEGGFRYTRETPRWERIEDVKLADDGIPYITVSEASHHEVPPETRQKVYEAFGWPVSLVLVTNDGAIKPFGGTDE
ncbi:hypothetical protein [Halolamina sp.]|uniref:hypothetical protein n=1 Tax=Halolamina sp. TaxID=1940283 RepID=UPI0035690C30